MVLGFGSGSGGSGGGAGGPGRVVGTVARGGAGVASAVLGLRVARPTVLRVSALLALRSLLSPLRLPLDSGVGAAIWAAAFAAAQTAAITAAAADRLRFWEGGTLASWGKALLSPVDAPFVALYAAFVLCTGPLVALVEAAVMTFEIMRLTRVLEERMRRAEEASFWQGVTLALSAVTALAAASIAVSLPVVQVSQAIAAVSAFVFGVALVTEAGNILHASALSLYTAVVLAAGITEHIDIHPGLTPLPRLHSPEARAGLLVVTTVLNLLSISRAFARTVLYGADAIAADYRLRERPTGFSQGAIHAVSVVALTFRFLVFNGDVTPGEYYPLVCRGLQVAAAVGIYCAILRVEGLEETDDSRCAPGSIQHR
jgi:hypothetical protein